MTTPATPEFPPPLWPLTAAHRDRQPAASARGDRHTALAPAGSPHPAAWWPSRQARGAAVGWCVADRGAPSWAALLGRGGVARPSDEDGPAVSGLGQALDEREIRVRAGPAHLDVDPM